MLNDILINLLIPLIPCCFVYALFGSVRLLIPGFVEAALVLVGMALPDHMHSLLPSSPAYSEVVFWGIIAAVVGAGLGYCWFLHRRGLPPRQIVVAQVLQAYTWVCIWYLVSSYLQGG